MNKVRVNLFTSYYKDQYPNRQEELDFCLRWNGIAGFDSINLLIEPKDLDFYNQGIAQRVKSNLIEVGGRPSFNDFFNAITDDNAINIVANSDIFMTPKELDDIRNYIMAMHNKEKVCLALSRWDFYSVGEPKHYDRPDSQDTWIFYGKPVCHASHEYGMGIAGCDNRLAHDIHVQGYTVINPSKTIRSYHYHETNIRHYVDAGGNVKQKVPPPYRLVPTS